MPWQTDSKTHGKRHGKHHGKRHGKTIALDLSDLSTDADLSICGVLRSKNATKFERSSSVGTKIGPEFDAKNDGKSTGHSTHKSASRRRLPDRSSARFLSPKPDR
jgi:hypothetical protein